MTGGSSRRGARLWPMLLAHTRSQFLMLWRNPAFSATSLALPVLLFTFLGLPFTDRTLPGGVSAGPMLLASFAAYGVGSVMVFAFGVGVAGERALRIDLLLRATPLPAIVHLAAKVIAAAVFAVASLVLLIGYGQAVAGIEQPLAVWADMVLRLLVGSLPFIGLGLAIGYSAGPQAAPALANLVYLPLAFASGLFLPLGQLPGLVQQVAPFLPTFHLAQLAWGAVGAASTSTGRSLAWLAAYAVAFLALAARAYQHEERHRFG